MRTPGGSQISMLVLSLAVAGPAPVRASPPVVDMGESRLAITDAESLLKAEEWDKAIARFEAGLERLPPEPGYAPTRARVLLRIVDANEAAFRDDGKLERLYRAGRLLDTYLGPLHLLDEEGRAAAEKRRLELLATIRQVEEENQQAALAAKRDSEKLEKAKKTRVANEARRRGLTLSKSGAVLTSVGVAGFGVMAAGLGLGVVTDKALGELTAKEDWSTPCSYLSQDCQDERRAEFDPLLARGQASNMMMIAGGVTSGVFLVFGITLLVLGAKQKRKANRLMPTATASSIGVMLLGHF